MFSVIRPLALAALFVGGLAVAPLARAQITNADIAKSLEYQQTGPSTVTPFLGGGAPGTNAFFYARSFSPVGEFDGGTLTYPGPGSPVSYVGYLLYDCCGNAAVGYQTGWMTQAAMDAAFPTGAYTLTSTNSATLATNAVTVPYAGSVYASVLPALDAASFSSLSAPLTGAGLTLTGLSWSPAGGTIGQDFFTIYDYTTSSYVANFPGYPVSSPSFYLPAGTLTAGDQYVYELIFDDFVAGEAYDSNGAPVPVEARSDLRTLGYFTAAGGAVPEPATWAMLILGLGATGLVLRRRRISAQAG